MYYYSRWFRASRIISSLSDDNTQVVKYIFLVLDETQHSCKIRKRWTEIVVAELRIAYTDTE
jgi:hypothetical protein